MATYSGNQYGKRSMFVFSGTGATNANFVGTISSSGTTLQYAAAGGVVVATQAELSPYIGNNAYLDYAQVRTGTRTELLPDGGITQTSFDYTPDPRSVVGFIVRDGFTGDHMDEIRYENSAGVTFQAFLGRLTTSDGLSVIPTGTALMDLVAPGISGSVGLNDGLFTITTGGAVTNVTNGSGATFINNNARIYIEPDSYRMKIHGQVANTSYGNQLNTQGITHITVGDATHERTIGINPADDALFEFLKRAAFSVFTTAVDGDAAQQSSIFTVHGMSGSTPGVELNAVTGGLVANTSVFEEFAAKASNKYVEIENIRQSALASIHARKTIRGIDEVSF